MLTADHGMELQDPQRRAAVTVGVRSSFRSGGLVYLKTLDVLVAPEPMPNAIVITVTDHDHGQPVSDAQLRCARCIPEQSMTNAEGTVRVVLTDGEEPVELEITHPDFNPQALRFTPGNNP